MRSLFCWSAHGGRVTHSAILENTPTQTDETRNTSSFLCAYIMIAGVSPCKKFTSNTNWYKMKILVSHMLDNTIGGHHRLQNPPPLLKTFREPCPPCYPPRTMADNWRPLMMEDNLFLPRRVSQANFARFHEPLRESWPIFGCMMKFCAPPVLASIVPYNGCPLSSKKASKY